MLKGVIRTEVKILVCVSGLPVDGYFERVVLFLDGIGVKKG